MNFKYLKFLLQSTNHHGVHSPFVYQFVTKCLYDKTYRSNIKNKDLKYLLKSINYFQSKTILSYKENEFLNEYILKVNDSIKIFNELKSDLKFDVVTLNHLESEEKKLQCFKTLLPNIDNDSILFFNHIYKNKTTQSIWEELKNHNHVTVTVDCFYFGFVFFRKEQVKQHFKIRV